MKAIQPPIVFKSISELMRAFDMPDPRHPLVALVNHDKQPNIPKYAGHSFLVDFYKISFKKDFRGQVKYGQGYYDFEAGGLAFWAPNQLVTKSGEESCYEGYTLYFHADLFRNYQLGKNIHQYGFFTQVSPRYLTDMLKSLTGQNAQQHIHDRLIQKAKDILSTTRLTIAEIAYQLGFEHPQSFNKLFKRHTSLSPTIFRKSFN
jgi:AraC-like DNA-binding protein